MTQEQTITEGNLRAVKDTDREDMWYLEVKDVNGIWRDVQWFNIRSIQHFFKTQLSTYN
jgi:hypothetical protein